MTEYTINTKLAVKFLTTLDPKAKTFCFQQLHDRKDKALPVTHLPLSELTKLNRKNRNGYGTFVTINVVEEGARRTSQNVTSIRAVYADDDIPRKKHRTDWPATPSAIIESSKGKYHYYWILQSNGLDASIAHSESLKSHIAEQFNTDAAGVKGPNRVLRLPGYIHQKKGQFQSNIADLNDTRYTISQLDELFKHDYQAVRHQSKEIASDTGLLDSLELIKQTNDGEYHVICPWADQHTDISDHRANFLFAGTGGHASDNFYCHHNSCGNKDINDVLLLAADDASQYLPTSRIPLPTPKVIQQEVNDMFRTAEQALQNTKEPDYLIENFIEANTVNILYGDTGTYKSFMVLHASICIASGKDFFGWRTEPGKVYYIASEGEGGIDRRVQANHKYYSHNTKGNLYLSNVPAKLGDKDYMAAMTKVIRDISANDPTALIIIDTLGASAPGLNTSDNQDMSAMVTLCKGIRKALNTTFLIVHHTGHANKERMKGASSLKQDVDGAYSMSVEQDTIVLKGEKMKDGELTPETYFLPHKIELGIHSKTNKPFGSLVLIEQSSSPGETLARTLELSGRKLVAFNILFEMGASTVSVDITEWRHLVQDRFDKSGDFKNKSMAVKKANNCVRELLDKDVLKTYLNKVKIKV